jgi:hypothetical protein
VIVPSIERPSVVLPVGSGNSSRRDGLASADDVAHVEAVGDARIVLVMLPDARLPSKRTPSNSVSMMKLTTPATASAPYTDEAPPVRLQRGG